MLVCISVLKCFDGDLTDKIVRSGGKWSPSLIIFILIDMDGGDNFILQAPRYQLGQTVGVGREDSFEALPLGMLDIFLFKKQYHLDIFRCWKISRIQVSMHARFSER